MIEKILLTGGPNTFECRQVDESDQHLTIVCPDGTTGVYARNGNFDSDLNPIFTWQGWYGFYQEHHIKHVVYLVPDNTPTCGCGQVIATPEDRSNWDDHPLSKAFSYQQMVLIRYTKHLQELVAGDQ